MSPTHQKLHKTLLKFNIICFWCISGISRATDPNKVSIASYEPLVFFKNISGWQHYIV